MSDKKNATGNGIGFLGALLIALMVLKILGKITISWWWVLSPIWIPTAIWILVILIFAVIGVSSNMRSQRRRKMK